jgi:hypothetical protein
MRMTGDDEEGARCDGEEGDESNGSCCYRPLPLAECTWKNTFPSIALTLWLLQQYAVAYMGWLYSQLPTCIALVAGGQQSSRRHDT